MPVYLEVGSKKVFACALDWPGWCRAGKTEDAALELLADTAERWAVVANEAGLRFAVPTDFDVVERVKGDATTDFGAPSGIAKADREAPTKAQTDRLIKVVEATWRVFDRTAKKSPAKMRKGPRGGGRDRDQMIEHVRNAEKAYGGKLGLAVGERDRDAIIEALRHPNPDAKWPPRYAARRIAWHVIDHAWEMEDKAV